MKSGTLRKALGLVLLYIGVFVLLVVVQFSRGPGFSEHIGRLEVSATIPRTQAGSPPARPSSFRLSFAGFILAASASSPLQFLAADGSSKPIGIVSLQRSTTGVLVQLDGGISLLCSSSGADGFSLAARGLDPGTALLMSYRLSGGAKLVSIGDNIRLDAQGGPFSVALDGVSLKQGQGLVSMASQPAGPSTIALEPMAAPASIVSAGGSTQFVAQAPKDPAVFAGEIAAWRDKVWSALAGSRFDTAKTAWKAADGSEAFSEQALDVYLAESLARGGYADALANVKAAKERWPGMLSYLSAPFLGGLAAKMPGLETADLAEVKRIGQLIQTKSLDLFTKEHLVRFLLDRAPYAMAQDAFRFASTVDPSQLSIRQDIGVLGCIVDSKSLLDDTANPFLKLGSVADRIVGAVRKSSQGFFLATDDDGSTDLRLSLLAGSYLVSYGTLESKDVLVGVGQSLVEGALGLSDAQGFCPARLAVKDGAAGQMSGSIAPESLYPIVAGNPYYPHEVSFSKDIAPGVWAWTCSPEMTVTVSGSQEVFHVRFPVGASHYLVLYGIKPFTNIKLYDIDYSPDPAFETYDASGFLYHRPTEALYMKMKHKKEVENIRLTF
ncbi:MAG TPA: hypothetical protein VMV90_01980 [Rectinemataceae bacterium]|nr:hypothetical protein [Rectinemataceae bacterium]